MKIKSLNIRTAYPRGYGANDPRLIQGVAEIQFSPDSYAYRDHEISIETMSKIVELVLADAAANPVEIAGPPLYFNEGELPPLPEPAPRPNNTTAEGVRNYTDDPF